MKKSRSWSLAAVVVATLGVAGAIWYWVRFTPTLEAATRTQLECIQRGDAACLMTYLRPEERLSQNVTQAKLQRLLSEYVLPAYGGLTAKATSEEVVPLKASGVITIQLSWSRGSRAPAVMGAMSAATPDGPKAVNLVRNLIFLTLKTKYRRSADEHQLLGWIRGMAADADQLRGIGFTGIYNIEEKRVEEWDALRASYLAKAKAHGVVDAAYSGE